jgi:hypothetical protein
LVRQDGAFLDLRESMKRATSHQQTNPIDTIEGKRITILVVSRECGGQMTGGLKKSAHVQREEERSQPHEPSSWTRRPALEDCAKDQHSRYHREQGTERERTGHRGAQPVMIASNLILGLTNNSTRFLNSSRFTVYLTGSYTRQRTIPYSHHYLRGDQ